MRYINSHLEDWIESFLINIGITQSSQLDKHKIANDLDIWIFYVNDTSHYVEVNNLYTIFLNKNLSKEEQWQDFAHELCHIVRQSSKFTNYHLTKTLWNIYQERQANYFAYHFCIPTFMLKNLDLPKDPELAILKVSNIFKVTPEFATHRLNLYNQKVFTQTRGVLHG
ncbi:ImmA/IrrE family metallo-endopeptidase [Bacillus pumilus]|uniref:ImmA/IrrE family metallo-endopeptidase n=1 Tax=Bacillus pumilus TaxID=1408 RepID=UPI0016427475|nr:ImmA/IrrE family metallo-endopeptidase [Bacillus pumilus]